MKLFGPIYERCLQWSRHHLAPRWLFLLSFTESVIFPVPPDAMLAPMSMAQPRKWWWFAFLCTAGSVLGGLLGYVLGHFALEAIWPWMQRVGWDDAFNTIQDYFQRYGFWFVFVAAFTPIPYKVFTIASGATGVGLLPFVVGSVIGRGLRFFLVAGLSAWGGERLEGVIRRWVEWLGWIVAIAIVLALVLREVMK